MTYLGLDIGTGAVKLAIVKGSAVQRLHCSVLTGELPREGQTRHSGAVPAHSFLR